METLALILAGGRGTRLDILSEKRSKPAVPFAGKFRIIDFALSNCCNSNIYNIGILTQYLPLSLNEHIGVGKPWDLDRRDSSVTLLQPSENWYGGTADAVLKNIEFIKRKNAKYVLILSGDHIYKMDYRELIKQHIEKNADLTIATKIVPMEETSRFGILDTDENLRITEFTEKPKNAKSDLASMGIYVFNTNVLIDAFKNIVAPELDFGKHIIPALIKSHNVYAFKYNLYWKDVGTYDSYLESNLELASENAIYELDMYDPNWKIYTKSEDLPSVKFGENAVCKSSLISNGCIIEGTVINSVLSPGVIVKKGTLVKDSVIMNNSHIGKNAVVSNSIIDKECIIGDNVKIGFGDDLTPNIEAPNVLYSGISVLGKHVIVEEDVIIERNCRIFGNNTLTKNEVIKSGTTIKEHRIK